MDRPARRGSDGRLRRPVVRVWARFDADGLDAALADLDGARSANEAAHARILGDRSSAGEGRLVLATWATLLDQGRMQDGEKFLAGTAQRTVARMSAATAGAHGLADGDHVSVSTEHGTVTAPVVVADGVDGVVWLPTNSPGSPSTTSANSA